MSGRRLRLHLARCGFTEQVSGLPNRDHAEMDGANEFVHSAMLLLTQWSHFPYIKMRNSNLKA